MKPMDKKGITLLVVFTIIALAVGNALAVANQVAGEGFDEDAVAIIGAAEGGFEGGLQRHAQVVEGEVGEFHGGSGEELGIGDQGLGLNFGCGEYSRKPD